MKKLTIYDLSKTLGVSTATINRALNGKPEVSEKTRKLITETAERMGYKPNKAATSLARKTINIGVIINQSVFNYNHELMNGAKKANEELSDFNVQGDFRFFSKTSSRLEIIEIMKEMGDMEYDGIIILPTNDLRGYAEVIQELYDKNIWVATAGSDIPNSKRLFYVFNDSRISGKIAGKLLTMLVSAKPVAIFTGTKDAGSHLENINGFIEEIKDSTLELVAVYENYDDPDIAYHATEKLIRDYPDIGGIYIGTSNSTNVCKKIVEAGLADKVKIIASDIFPELNDYLRQGVVQATIFQQPFQQGYIAFKTMYEHIADGKQYDELILLAPQIVLESNLEIFTKLIL